jgi:hypothetical protein
MATSSRHNGHDKYKSRITNLFNSYSKVSDPEEQAHNAKYLAVLVSGYLEQAIKELLLQYASKGSRSQISKYIEKTWPISKNMKADNIETILSQFDSTWGNEFQAWLRLDELRKGHINSIVEWRNSIAHGQESNTTGVTLVSVRSAFSTIRDLVSFIDNLVST